MTLTKLSDKCLSCLFADRCDKKKMKAINCLQPIINQEKIAVNSETTLAHIDEKKEMKTIGTLRGV